MFYHRCRINRIFSVWRDGIVQMGPRADACAAHLADTTARRNAFALFYQCLAEVAIRADIIIIVRDFYIDSTWIDFGVGHDRGDSAIGGGKYIGSHGCRNINTTMHTPRSIHRVNSIPKRRRYNHWVRHQWAPRRQAISHRCFFNNRATCARAGNRPRCDRRW